MATGRNLNEFNKIASRPDGKVTARHLTRSALLYVRQSSARQVLENQESTRRQYALRESAVALGWKDGQVETIDCDLGLSGASTVDRLGFQRLVGEVALGKVGIVLGLEVSRLARNNSDWHQLLELCGRAGTLIKDEDGLYDPADFNDRMLLGLKGTMSEAELHFLRARLRGGLLAKANRGELRVGLPVGLCYDAADRVVLHPDAQVRAAVAMFFESFARIGSACGVVRHFRENGLRFPVAAHSTVHTQEVVWGRLSVSRAIVMLRSPRYAGAFSFGRTRTTKRLTGGLRSDPLPRDQWHSLILDAHPAYISWEQHERNLHLLKANGRRFSAEERNWTPREGPALLQGLVVCGKCGKRMLVRYQQPRNGQPVVVSYRCLLGTTQYQEKRCQQIHGREIDAAISDLVLQSVNPMAVQLTLQVQAELRSQQAQAEKLRQLGIKRAEYEVDLARRRYMQVDPANRLVAADLEAAWNGRMEELQQTRGDAAQRSKAEAAQLDSDMQARIVALSADFGSVWNDAATPTRERKRMIALLIEDVTLSEQGERFLVQVRWRGGATSELTVQVPINAWTARRTHPDALELIRQLTGTLPAAEIASKLNERGYVTGDGKLWQASAVNYQCWRHDFGEHSRRNRPAGTISRGDMMAALGRSESAVKRMRKDGKLLAVHHAGTHFAYLPLDQQPEAIQRLAVQRAANQQRAETTPSLREV